LTTSAAGQTNSFSKATGIGSELALLTGTHGLLQRRRS